MIVVFGSINLDLTAVVQRIPKPGETISGTSFAAVPGGKGANQALAACRAGASVAMAGRVGNDAFATTVTSGLVAAGVDTGWVEAVDAPTGVALIHVDARGRNSITVVPGANARLAASAVPDAAFDPGSTLVLQLEVPLDEVTAIAVRAHARGTRVVLNAAPALPLPPSLLESLDVLVVNEHEAASLASTLACAGEPEAFATTLHRRLGCAVVVTLGSQGALVACDGDLFSVAAPMVEAVDTTGAGDAFVGALAAALDRGAAWPRAAAEGVAAGTLACGRKGAQASLPAARAIAQLADEVESTIILRPVT